MSDTTKKTNDGGAAFPRPAVRQQTVEGIYCDSPQTGMTLRAYFAAKALQGILAAPDRQCQRSFTADVIRKGLTEEAVLLADALIAELDKEPS